MSFKDNVTGRSDTLKKFLKKRKRLIGITAFTLAYPTMQLGVRYIPNPMVPGANIALNMIMPVLAGYFFGPWSGAFAGGIGTGIASILSGSIFTVLAIIPHTIMGAVAGWTGRYRSEFLTASTILIGHSLNMLFYLGTGVITIAAGKAGETLLGLATEAMIDIIAIVILILLLKRYLYCTERW
jgi:uncharacterized membrane protein